MTFLHNNRIAKNSGKMRINDKSQEKMGYFERMSENLM